MRRGVTVELSCRDTKPDRNADDSKTALRRSIVKRHKNTNWRLTERSIHVQLGYLTGRLRVHESDADLRRLVEERLGPTPSLDSAPILTANEQHGTKRTTSRTTRKKQYNVSVKAELNTKLLVLIPARDGEGGVPAYIRHYIHLSQKSVGEVQR